jgi:hypothetical protein
MVTGLQKVGTVCPDSESLAVKSELLMEVGGSMQRELEVEQRMTSFPSKLKVFQSTYC